MQETRLQLSESNHPLGRRIFRAARMAHEANRIYKASLGENPGYPFDSLTEEQQEPVLAGVLNVIEADLTCNRYEEKEAHEAWMAWNEERNPDGWDHPCNIPWEDLPEEQVAKDTIFLTFVRVALALP